MVFKSLAPPAVEYGGVEVEVGTGENHKNDDGNFKAEVLVLADAAVFGAEPAGGHGAESMAKGLENIHALESEAKKLG